MSINKEKAKQFLKDSVSFVVQTIVVILLSIFIQSKTLQPVKIEGPSMEPTFFEGEQSVVRTWDKIPDTNDIVVFAADGVDPKAAEGTYYVKRVIGTPGDTIRVENGQLYVNDKLVLQPYLKDDPENNINSAYERTNGTQSRTGEVNWDLSTLSKDNDMWKPEHRNTSVVPEGYYFVMGDHRSRSVDSRYFGYVPSENMIGTVNK